MGTSKEQLRTAAKARHWWKYTQEHKQVCENEECEYCWALFYFEKDFRAKYPRED